MSSDLSKPYNSKEVEGKIYKAWEKSGFFNPDNLNVRGSTSNIEAFSIVIPPPNITGTLHMGHALNATIQDILIRKKRMEGYKTLWLPGTDHAGIATQNIVEKELLKKEGKTRYDLGREKFVERIWQWKEKYGNEILNQLKQLGSSCDWSRARFTMDKDYQKAVQVAFTHYYKKGWIYQAERVINWCPRCQTSLSDLELDYKERKGKLYYIKYLPADKAGGPVTVATTRPETMLGDTAVAVNPKDERYKKLIGKKVILPIVEKEIPVIADKRVDPKFGTGAVKVTPAHSIIDAEIAETHNLPAVKAIDTSGKITFDKYSGLSINKARQKIIEDLEEKELIEKTEEYEHNIALCDRCGNVIENLPSKQWFLKMDELAKMAIKAVKTNKVVFHPKRWEKIYLDWFSNIKDWCISRQLWWGHKIPIDGVDDVLDTWFSSALWPFATMSEKGLKEFYPTNVLSTARDIINLWVARMVFSGLEFTKKTPFKDVVIHPTILTKKGKRMSKSLGTGIDPMDYIEKYGADATRFGLIWQIMSNQDIHWAEEHVIAGKKFCNKLWNISRFVLQQTGNSKFQIPNYKLQNDDKKILEKLDKIIKTVNKNIEDYKFGQALHAIYDFVWHDFADNYIEYSKTKEKDEVKQILSFVLINVLKLLHPFVPFITEEIWSKLPIADKKLLIVEKWPQ
jgi:valyl-tRNA synthetase